MKVQFKTFDSEKIMVEKITAVRRAEGQILTIARELKAQGIILNDINLEVAVTTNDVKGVNMHVTI